MRDDPPSDAPRGIYIHLEVWPGAIPDPLAPVAAVVAIGGRALPPIKRAFGGGEHLYQQRIAGGTGCCSLAESRPEGSGGGHPA